MPPRITIRRELVVCISFPQARLARAFPSFLVLHCVWCSTYTELSRSLGPTYLELAQLRSFLIFYFFTSFQYSLFVSPLRLFFACSVHRHLLTLCTSDTAFRPPKAAVLSMGDLSYVGFVSPRSRLSFPPFQPFLVRVCSAVPIGRRVPLRARREASKFSLSLLYFTSLFFYGARSLLPFLLVSFCLSFTSTYLLLSPARRLRFRFL